MLRLSFPLHASFPSTVAQSWTDLPDMEVKFLFAIYDFVRWLLMFLLVLLFFAVHLLVLAEGV